MLFKSLVNVWKCQETFILKAGQNDTEVNLMNILLNA